MVFKKVKRKITKVKAKMKGVSVKEYEKRQKRLRKLRRQEQQKFEEFKIKEEYKQKRTSFKKRGKGGGGWLDKIGDYSEGVVKNFEEAYELGSSTRRTSKRKKKTKRKKKRVTLTID